MILLAIIQSLRLGGTEKHISYVLPYLAKHTGNKIYLLIINNQCDKKLLKKLKESEVKVIILNKFNVLQNKYTKQINIFLRLFNIYILSYKIKLYLEKNKNHFKFIKILYLHCNKFFKKTFDIFYVACIFFIVKFIRANAIITFNNRNNRLNSLLSKICNTKSIFSKRGEDYGEKYKFLKAFNYNLANAIIVNSLDFRDQLLESGVDTNKINLIYNGVPQQKNNFSNINYKQKKITIIYLANFRKVKDHITFLRSINDLRNYPIDIYWEAYCIGNDKNGYLEYLMNYSKKLKLKNKVKWIINPTKINYFLSNADIAVHTSLSEGLSNSILELMSFGVPIISTKVGAHQDIIKNGLNGYLVNKKDFKNISYLIYSLIKDKKKRIKISNESYKNYINNFTLEKCTDKYSEVLKKIST